MKSLRPFRVFGVFGGLPSWTVQVSRISPRNTRNTRNSPGFGHEVPEASSRIWRIGRAPLRNSHFSAKPSAFGALGFLIGPCLKSEFRVAQATGFLRRAARPTQAQRHACRRSRAGSWNQPTGFGRISHFSEVGFPRGWSADIPVRTVPGRAPERTGMSAVRKK
jgi:hypothetical protein